MAILFVYFLWFSLNKKKKKKKKLMNKRKGWVEKASSYVSYMEGYIYIYAATSFIWMGI
jgi:hypothetical protein